MTVGYIPIATMAPLYLVADKYAQQVGFEMELERSPSGGEIIAGISTGQLDFGAPGIGAALFTAFNEGLPLEIVAPMLWTYPENFWSLSSTVADSEEEAQNLAQDMASLSGETFALNAPGTATEWQTSRALREGGLTLDDVNIEYISFPDQVPALANGSVMGAQLVEPFATIATGNGSAFLPLEQRSEGERPDLVVVVIQNETWADENPELAQAFLEAYAMAIEELGTDGWLSEDVLESLASYTDVNTEVIARSMPPAHPDDYFDPAQDQMSDYQDFFMERGSIEYTEPIRVEDMWDLTWTEGS